MTKPNGLLGALRTVGFAAIGTAMLIGGIVSLTGVSAEARPSYGQNIGKLGQCNFCHVGTPGNKVFNNDGYAYAKGLVAQNLLAQSVFNTLTLQKPCRLQTIKLYDQNGNFKQDYTHCVS